jgi:hypothetical protein
MNPRAASSIIAALPSCRVLLLFGGIVLLSESVALATTLLVAGGLSFAATLLLAAKMYRAPGRRPGPEQVRDVDQEAPAAAVLAPCGTRVGVSRAPALPHPS